MRLSSRLVQTWGSELWSLSLSMVELHWHLRVLTASPATFTQKRHLYMAPEHNFCLSSRSYGPESFKCIAGLWGWRCILGSQGPGNVPSARCLEENGGTCVWAVTRGYAASWCSQRGSQLCFSDMSSRWGNKLLHNILVFTSHQMVQREWYCSVVIYYVD